MTSKFFKSVASALGFAAKPAAPKISIPSHAPSGRKLSEAQRRRLAITTRNMQLFAAPRGTKAHRRHYYRYCPALAYS